MRRLALVLACLALLVPVASHASVIVGHCGGTATLTLVPPKAGGSCTGTFTLGAATRVWLGFEPGDDLTGTIQASISNAGGGFSIRAAYYSGQVVGGTPIQFFDATAGTWKLTVIAGGAPPDQPCLPPNPVTQQCVIGAGAAIGGFAASVSA